MANSDLSQPQPVRFGGFDWIRVLAALGVVLLHSSTPYLTSPMPGLVWPVSDVPSTTANVVGWSIEVFIMPLFLMVAGFFTPAMYQRQGISGFIKQRFWRLIVPLAAAMVLILPADLYIWLLGWVIEGLIPLRKMQSLKFDGGIDEGLWGLSHLWFLQYLFLYGICWAVYRHFFRGSMKKWSMWKVVSVVTASWLVLFAETQVVFGFQHSFLPVPSKWVYSGMFFLGGIALYEWESLRLACGRNRLELLMIGLLAALLGAILGCQMLENTHQIVFRFSATACTVVSAWCVAAGALGWAVEYQQPASRGLRYLAAASFWVYLIHHPIVGLAHIQLKVCFPNLLPEAKMLAAAVCAITFSLLSFEVVVRRYPLAMLFATPSELVKGKQVLPDAKTRSENESGGNSACQDVSSTGLFVRRWLGSSSVSTQ